jgi:hypothetical protein
MPTPKTWSLLLLYLLLVGTATSTVWLPPLSGPTRANCYRIKFGMTEQQVEAILGGPGRTDFGIIMCPDAEEEGPRPVYPVVKGWRVEGKPAMIFVMFGPDGTVEERLLMPIGVFAGNASPKSILDRWRRWFLGR